MNHFIRKINVSLALSVIVSAVMAQNSGPVVGQQINVAPNINTADIAEPLNFLVNTSYKEYGPMPTKDGARLYFSRHGHPQNMGGPEDEDIWYSEFDEVAQSWKEAINMGAPLNNTGPNFITGIGVAGDTILLGNVYGKKDKMRSGVSISIRVGTLWSFPQPVNIAGDYNLAAKTGYDLSSDRTALIIAQEKADSRGKLDLYVALRDPDAKYPYSAKESFNLGDVINTFGDETSPWLSYDNRTLFFASDGHNGYGKLDLFMSKRLDNTWTNWSEPVNLGPGINSVYDDVSFNFNPKDRFAYFSRGLSSANSDIFRVDMTNLFNPIRTPVANLTENTSEIGQVHVIQNVFDSNSSEIKPSATSDLSYMLSYLTKFDNMIIMISAHSNVSASRAESLVLSNQRAVKVMDYLVKNGISSNRLSYRGLGHDIVANTSDPVSKENVAASVEFKLIGF